MGLEGVCIALWGMCAHIRRTGTTHLFVDLLLS